MSQQQTVLAGNAARWGTVEETQSPPPTFRMDLPTQYADTGDPTANLERRGIWTFDASGLDPGLVILSATLACANIAYAGSANQWDIGFYSGGRLVDDAETVYQMGELCLQLTKNGPVPLVSFEEPLDATRLAALISADQEIVLMSRFGAYSGSFPVWKPEAAYATLTLITAFPNTLSSGLGRATSLASGRGAASSGSSGRASAAALASSRTGTEEAASGRAGATELDSDLGGED